MKKYFILIITLAFIFISCSDNSVNVAEPVPDPTNYYELDIKSPFFDKYDAQGVKAGLITYVKKYGGWCSLKEYFEDYSVWVEDLSRKKISATDWEISFLLSVSEPSNTYKKGVYKEKRLKLRYSIPSDIDTYQETYDRYVSILNKGLELTNKYGQYDKRIEIFSTAGLDIMSFVNDCRIEFSDSDITKARKAEALFCGQAIGELLKLWFVDYEKKGSW